MEDAVEGARRRTIALPGGEMAALAFGPRRDPDVIFVHANGFNARTYRSILGPLGDQLAVLAVDMRGHGRSTLPAPPTWRRNWNDIRDDLVHLLDTLDAPPLVMAGHSMGGTCSLLAAARRPDRVRGLVLFDPVIMPRSFSFWAAMPWSSGVAWRGAPIAQGALKRRAEFDSREAAIKAYTGRGAFKTWAPEMLADYVADGFKDRPDGKVELACAPAWEASNFGAQGQDPWPAVGQVRAPIRVLRAEHASTCRIGTGFDFARRGPHVTIQTVEGTSHFLPMERPDLVRKALLAAAAG